MDTELVYAADPMCSWCYGFGPELELVRDTYPDVPLRIVMGGLWVGARAQPLNDELKAYLRQAWTNVHAASGQPFNFDLLEWDGWTYDTEPACRAVVTMRAMAPGHEKRFFGSLQYAFYAVNSDLADEFTFTSLLEGYPVEIDEFMLNFRSQEMVDATKADFHEARKIGALGFPTLFVRQDDSFTPLTRGYAKAPKITRIFDVLAGGSDSRS